MWNKNFVYILNYLKILKAVLKNNLRTHSLKQNKKAVLTTAAYFEVSTPSRKVAETIIALRLPSFTKNCFRYKTEKVNTIEFCIFDMF